MDCEMLINSGGTAESAAESVPTGSGELTPDKPHKSGVRWNKTYEEAPSVKQEHPILHGGEDVRSSDCCTGCECHPVTGPGCMVTNAYLPTIHTESLNPLPTVSFFEFFVTLFGYGLAGLH
jgi:hypothetical protein